MPDLGDVPTLRHGTTVVAPGVRLHHVSAGHGRRTIVLVHGYPQTWWSWRHVIGPLADAGLRVVAPDYRGAGSSSKPAHGYDKRTMAGDLATLVTDGLGIEGPVTVVGNDIGMMIAYAFGREHPDLVERLVLMESVLPGTAVYDRLVATSTLAGAPMWHFFFHNASDGLAEALTAGRERLYLRHFYDRHAFDPEAISPADVDRYTDAFARTGAMRAGFELYRAFDQDAADNRAALARDGRLRVPVLALGGEGSVNFSIAAEMLSEVAEDVTVVGIPRCGHWVAEENPTAFLEHLLRFVDQP